MKKMYEAPVCETICTAEDDILTSSQFIEFGKGENGDFSGGGVIEW